MKLVMNDWESIGWSVYLKFKVIYLCEVSLMEMKSINSYF